MKYTLLAKYLSECLDSEHQDQYRVTETLDPCKELSQYIRE